MTEQQINPKVSILIVTYNHEEFIEEALKSAIDQNYPNLEIVVTDDNSTDRTVEIINSYQLKYPNLVFQRNLVNGGITKNHNAGLSRCSGEYIAILGGDDVFLPGKITAQVNWFKSDPNRVVCGHAIEKFSNKTGEILGIYEPIGSKYDVKSWIRNGMLLGASSLMVKKSAVPKTGFDEKLSIACDWKFVIEILLNGGECGYVVGKYIRYRMHETNITKLSCNLDSVYFKQSYFDGLMTISWLEAFHPQYLSDCQIRRTKLFFSNLLQFIINKRWDLVGMYLNPVFRFAHLSVFFGFVGKQIKRKILT